MEAKRWPSQYFITLTYDNENIPISNNGFATLWPDDLRNFWKRLRKRVGRLRYYACGEYGTRGQRPHYHAIVFASQQQAEAIIKDEWEFGDVHFGRVEPASIRYTVQYYDKGHWSPSHVRDDRIPEFSRMSQGIGSNFIDERRVKDFLDKPGKGYIYDHEGRKIATPRYYKKRLFDFHISAGVVAEHPSILIHRDDMLQEKKKHIDAVAKEMAKIPQIEEDEKLREDRKHAILNYKQQKRKTRK